MSKRRLVRLVLEWVVVFVMVVTSLVGMGAMQVSPRPPRQATFPALTQPVSHAQLAPVASSPASSAGTWYAPHQPVYGPQAVIPTTPTFPQGRKPGEQSDLRTAASQTILNTDGAWTLKAYPFPIYYQDASGAWQPIDNTVAGDTSDTGYAYGNKANGWHVHFAKQAGGSALVHAQLPTGPVVENLVGAASVSATTRGSTILYPGVFPGTDVEYNVGSLSLEAMLLLHNAQGPASYSFTYHVPGATATQDSAGDVTFTDAKGNVLFVVGGILMYEANAQGQMTSKAALSQAVAVSLTSQGSDFTITLTPDQTWLSDPKRHFPVAIDPTLSWQSGDPQSNTTDGNIYADTIDESGNPTSPYYNLNSLRIGNANVDNGLCCNGTSRAYLKFPVNPPPTHVRVTSADLAIYQSSMYSGGGVQIIANSLVPAWNATTLTWNTHPTSMYQVGSATTAANQNTWIHFNLKDAAYYWWEALWPQNGIELQYADESKPQEFFFSDDNTNSWGWPTLTINYVQDTTAPSGSVSFNGGVGSTNQTTVTVTPQGADAGAINEWNSNWSTVNGVYTSNLPPNSSIAPAYSVDSTHTQLIADTSSCGSTQCWVQTTFTHSMNVNNWPTYTVTFKTDNVSNVYFGLTSADNSSTRAELDAFGASGFDNASVSSSLGSYYTGGIHLIPISANTWYNGQVVFTTATTATYYIWPVGGVRPTSGSPSEAFADLAMTNPVLTIWQYGDNGANLHHLYIGNVTMTSKDTTSGTVGYGVVQQQFSTDGTNYGCPSYTSSNTAFSGGAWCVYSPQSFSWTFPTGDGKKTLWYKTVDNTGTITSGSMQIIYDTTAPTVNYLSLGASTASAQGSEVRGLVTLTVNATDPLAADGSHSGVASAVLYVDGVQAGTPVAGTSVPTFTWNTTNLSPGEHVLTAKATDAAGNASAIGGSTTVIVDNTGMLPFETYAKRTLPDGQTAVSVNVANGDTVVTHGDLVIPGRGPDLSISRTYHALGYLNGLFGWGWTSELDEHLVLDTDSSMTYYDAAGGVHIFLSNGSGGYLTSPGLYLTLVKNGDGSYTLSSRDQSKTNFNASGLLTSVVDRNGNTLSVTYDSNNHPQTVTDAAGRSLTITTSGGHVTQITDPNSRLFRYYYDSNGNLTDYIDPSGVDTAYGYDSSHRLNSMTLNYIANGGFDQQTNVGTALTYDTTATDSNYNRLTGLTDPLGYVVNVSYSISSGTTALQTVVAQQQGISPATYENTTYLATTDGFGAVSKLTDALGGATTYQYDANENVLQVTDPDGHVASSTYDSNGNRLTQTVDPGSSPHLALTTTWTYDSANNVLAATDPRGIVTQYTYDGPTTGNLTKMVKDYVSGGGSDSQTNVTTTSTYDSYGEVLTTTDPLGIVTKYTYDTQGDVLTTTANYVSGGATDSQTNVVTSATYDVLGEKLTATSAPTASMPQGVVTSSGYDILGHLQQTIANYQPSQPADQQTNVKTQYGYDPLGRQVTVTNPLGIVTLTTYDKDGRVTQTTRNYVSGATPTTDTNVLWSQVIYDAAGNVLVSKDAKTLSGDPTGNITTTTYDLDNRPLQVKVTDNASTPHILQNSKTVYDAAGLTSESDTFSLDGTNTVLQAVTYTYDGAGRRSTQTDPPAIPGFPGFLGTSNVTITTYDADGNAIDTKETNAALSSAITESTATFDKLNRPLTKTEQANTASAQTSSFTYDVDGRQLTFTDPANNTTSSTYDALGRTLTVTHPGTPTVIDYTTYDPAGERLTQCNSAGITSDTYDALGRVTYEEHDTLASGASCPTLTQAQKVFQTSVTTTYDANGNKLTQLTNFPGGTSSTYSWTYDKLDRPLTMSDGTRVYTYDLNGNIIKETVGNFIETDVTYDGENRTNTLTDKVGSSGTTLHSYSYSYDALGNQNQITTDGVATTYTYDALSELTQVQQGSTTTSYTYDANGNRATMVTSAGTTTYSYDSADVELTSKTDPTNKVTNYTYDANGNLTKAVYDPSGVNQTTTYTYDKNNRLTTITEPNGTTVTFSYDADGNRISKAVTSGGATTTVNDVYALGRLDHQTDGSGNIIATYTYAANGEPTSVVVGSPTTGTRYYYVYNGHGDVVALTDNTGAIKASYTYDAFGNLLPGSTETFSNVPPGWSNPYRYDGAEGARYDPETGLYWMSVRAYDPTLGRFISHDPLGRLAAMGLDLQPYVYVGGNPINQSDPSGLVSCRGPMPDGYCLSIGSATGSAPCMAQGGCDNNGDNNVFAPLPYGGGGCGCKTATTPTHPKPPSGPTSTQINNARLIALKAAGFFLARVVAFSVLLALLPAIIDLLGSTATTLFEAATPFFSNPFTAIVGIGLVALGGLAMWAMGQAIVAERTLPAVIGLYATLAAAFAAQAASPDSAWTSDQVFAFGNGLKTLSNLLVAPLAFLTFFSRNTLGFITGKLSLSISLVGAAGWSLFIRGDAIDRQIDKYTGQMVLALYQ